MSNVEIVVEDEPPAGQPLLGRDGERCEEQGSRRSPNDQHSAGIRTHCRAPTGT